MYHKTGTLSSVALRFFVVKVIMKTMKLFCFSFAGGTADFYNGLKKNLNGHLEVIAPDYPGHGRRYDETLLSSVPDMARDMLETITKQIEKNEPYALMGYSMGSIVVYELLRMLEEKKSIDKPLMVFLAAHEPKGRRTFMELSGLEGDERIRSAVRLFGGVPEKLLCNKTFWRVYLPVYRADFAAIWEYDFAAMKYKADVPATVFYSPEDTPDEDIRQWDEFFTEASVYHSFSGNHFFLRDHEKEIAELIKEALSNEIRK